MSFKYVVNHVTQSKTSYRRSNGSIGYRRPMTRINPNSVTIHSTGNDNSLPGGERGYLENPNNNRAASWHIVVGEHVAIEAIPLNELTYHSGTSIGNRSSISIEMCHTGNRAKVLKNTQQLAAIILYKNGWGINRLKRHHDWSGKNCPSILNYRNWEGWRVFKREVEKYLKILNNPPKAKPEKKDPHEPSKWARTSWGWASDIGLFDGKNPKEKITREQAMTVIKRMYEKGLTLKV